jgi:hypothetical protein
LPKAKICRDVVELEDQTICRRKYLQRFTGWLGSKTPRL